MFVCSGAGGDWLVVEFCGDVVDGFSWWWCLWRWLYC